MKLCRLGFIQLQVSYPSPYHDVCFGERPHSRRHSPDPHHFKTVQSYLIGSTPSPKRSSQRKQAAIVPITFSTEQSQLAALVHVVHGAEGREFNRVIIHHKVLDHFLLLRPNYCRLIHTIANIINSERQPLYSDALTSESAH